MSKHPKQCPSTYLIRNYYPIVVRCQKHLRHKNREHQFNGVRWSDSASIPISTQEGTK